jgi:hypothetical protein
MVELVVPVNSALWWLGLGFAMMTSSRGTAPPPAARKFGTVDLVVTLVRALIRERGSVEGGDAVESESREG